MSDFDDLRHTLQVMHALAAAGIVEQVFRDDGFVYWKLIEGSEAALDALVKELIDADDAKG